MSRGHEGAGGSIPPHAGSLADDRAREPAGEPRDQADDRPCAVGRPSTAGIYPDTGYGDLRGLPAAQARAPWRTPASSRPGSWRMNRCSPTRNNEGHAVLKEFRTRPRGLHPRSTTSRTAREAMGRHGNTPTSSARAPRARPGSPLGRIVRLADHGSPPSQWSGVAQSSSVRNRSPGVAPPVLDVALRGPAQREHRLLVERAHHARRRSDDQRIVRKRLALGDQRVSRPRGSSSRSPRG